MTILRKGKLCKSAPEDSICVNKWNDRYFVLEGGDCAACLKYHQNEDEFKNGSEGQEIDLQGCVEIKEENEKEKHRYLFSITTSLLSENKGRIFLIGAKDENDRTEWIKCINNLINPELAKNQEKDDESNGLVRTTTGATTASNTTSGYGSIDEEISMDSSCEGAGGPVEADDDHEGNGATGEDNSSVIREPLPDDGVEVDIIPRPRTRRIVKNGIECPHCKKYIDLNPTIPHEKSKKKASESSWENEDDRVRKLARENSDHANEMSQKEQKANTEGKSEEKVLSV